MDQQIENPAKMENVIVFTKPACPNCVLLKNLLKNKNVEYNVVELDFGQETNFTKLSIAEFKQLYPQVSAMPFFTATYITSTMSQEVSGGLSYAMKLLK